MSLESTIVNVTITRQTVFPTRAGFGIPLLLVYHTRTGNMVDQFTGTKGMLDAGFTVNDPAYKMAAAAFSQNPSPAKVVIGRRLTAQALVIKILPLNTTVGYKYSLDYVDATGLVTNVTYTVATSDTAIIIGTALRTAIEALASSSTTVNGGTGEVTITASVAGAPFDLKNLPGVASLHVVNTTVDSTIVADYAAVKAVDAATWYGVTVDGGTPEAAIEALAAQIETEHKLFAYETSDSDCANVSVTTDLMSDLKAAAYARTGGLFSQNQIRSQRSSAWMAKALAAGAEAPGSNNWAGMTLNGITKDVLTDGEIPNLAAKRGNVYVDVAGLNLTYSGLVADGEFFDILVGSDWLFARLQERIIGAFANASNSGSKIPYTDVGASIIRGMVLAQLAEGVRDNGRGGSFLAADPAPTCTVPKVKDVDPALRALRQLPNVNFQATLAGAINSVVINGVLTV